MRAPRITVAIDGAELRFRAPVLFEAEEYLETVRAAPGESLAAGLVLCQVCADDDATRFALAALSEERPLALADLVLPRLFTVAQATATRTRKAGVARWKRSETNLASIAESLLAFKAYVGGEPTEAEYAGALQVAEWVDATRGTFRLVHGFMKAMGRRRG